MSGTKDNLPLFNSILGIQCSVVDLRKPESLLVPFFPSLLLEISRSLLFVLTTLSRI